MGVLQLQAPRPRSHLLPALLGDRAFLDAFGLTKCCLAHEKSLCYCDRGKARPLSAINRKMARANHIAAVERILKKNKIERPVSES